MTMRKMLATLALCSLATTAQAGGGCENLKAAIDAKIQAKGVRGYSLDIVAAGDVGSAKVVGNCEGGTKRIVYARGDATAMATQPAGDRPATPPPTAAKPAPKPKAAPALGNY